MKVEWSDEALADLERFVEFLDQKYPSLATTVANEIISKVQMLTEHPRLGRPIRGRVLRRQQTICSLLTLLTQGKGVSIVTKKPALPPAFVSY
jgi:plasmid stabilization system protein ParE